MALRLCPPCDNLLINYGSFCQIFEHHQNLSELKYCAESYPGQCLVCRLFWAIINKHSSAGVVQHYLDDWNVDIEPNEKLNLVIDLQSPVPDNLANIRANGLNTDESQRIDIRVNKKTRGLQDEPVTHFGSASISVPPSSIAAKELRGRNVKQSANFGERADTISITKAWLNKCESFHKRCNGKKPTPMPSRVVDIRRGKPRLLTNQSNKYDIYVALSYSWGDNGSNMLKLKKETQAALESEISFDKLRRSHQHGIQVARELGYDYIWIDALCIVQNDKHDWAKQSSLITEIYGNADLTIVAGRSSHSGNGFLELTSATSVPPVQLPYESPGISGPTSCWIGVTRNRNIGPVSDRAWCFQEALISRRMIIYGEQQLSFRCRERHDFEDGHWEFVGAMDTWYNYSFLARHFASPSFHPKVFQAKDRNTTGCTNLTVTVMGKDLILKRWYEVTTEYSSRSFFNPTDNHAALSGVVRQVQLALVRSGLDPDREIYMAGLWEIDMVRGLLWRSRRIEDSRFAALQAPLYEGRVVRRAPSWSWMALVGPICQQSFVESRLCVPANLDRKTWSPEPNGWGPSMIEYEKFPDPYRLEVKTYIREVRISQQGHGLNIYANPPTFHCSLRSIEQLTFPLEAAEIGPLNTMYNLTQLEAAETGMSNEFYLNNLIHPIVATGFFDIEYAGNRPLQIWAMCVTSEEGLLLQQIQDPKSGSIVYKRLGIFAVGHMPTFYPQGSIEKTGTLEYHVIKDKLPVENVVLI